MAADERTDAPARETAASSSTFRRRGLIAGAAALVAGALAKQAVTPVSAYDSTHTFQSVVGVNYGPDGNADGVQGYAAGANTAGIFGRNNDFNGVGVWGAGTNGNGVYGQSQQGTGVAGNSSSGFGVGGQSTSNTGVSGYSTSGVGVQGKAASNVGVFGITADNAAPAIQGLSNGNSIAVNGLAQGSGIGVVGQGNTGSGVAGYTRSTTFAAVVGNGTATDGVYGNSTNGWGVHGISTHRGVVGESQRGCRGRWHIGHEHGRAGYLRQRQWGRRPGDQLGWRLQRGLRFLHRWCRGLGVLDQQYRRRWAVQCRERGDWVRDE